MPFEKKNRSVVERERERERKRREGGERERRRGREVTRRGDWE